MKSFFLYTLATIGVAALTFFLILVSAPPVMGSVDPQMPSIEEKAVSSERIWMKALKTKMGALAAQVSNNKPEPVSETEQPESKTSDYPSDPESDWLSDVTPGDVASFSSYQSPSPYGRKVENTSPAVKTAPTGQSARLKQFLSSGGSGGFNGGGSVAAGNQGGSGRDNSGLNDYRDSLIAVLLKSLSENEMEELIENQTERQNAQAN